MKFIKKYFWQIISTLVALLAVFATYQVFFISRATKSLQVDISTPIALVSVRPEALDDIEVFYKGETVKYITLLQLSIQNNGNQPIQENDFSRALSFSFSESDEIADVSVTDSNPPNIGIVINKVSDIKAEVEPTLLNPEDSVSIQFIIVSPDETDILSRFEVDGRISGVKEAKVVYPSEQGTILSSKYVNIIAAIFGVLVSALAFSFTEGVIKKSSSWIFHRILRSKSDGELVVISANYGAFGKLNDVTELLNANIKDGGLEIVVSNDNLGGDPIPGTEKRLEVIYSVGNKRFTKAIDENETLVLP